MTKRVSLLLTTVNVKRVNVLVDDDCDLSQAVQMYKQGVVDLEWESYWTPVGLNKIKVDHWEMVGTGEELMGNLGERDR